MIPVLSLMVLLPMTFPRRVPHKFEFVHAFSFLSCLRASLTYGVHTLFVDSASQLFWGATQSTEEIVLGIVFPVTGARPIYNITCK